MTTDNKSTYSFQDKERIVLDIISSYTWKYHFERPGEFLWMANDTEVGKILVVTNGWTGFRITNATPILKSVGVFEEDFTGKLNVDNVIMKFLNEKIKNFLFLNSTYMHI